jgi:hypothetical protein
MLTFNFIVLLIDSKNWKNGQNIYYLSLRADVSYLLDFDENSSNRLDRLCWK